MKRDNDQLLLGHAPGSKYTHVMVPVWQIAPIKTNEKAVMVMCNASDHMMQHNVPTFTAILQLVQDVETRPSSILFYPIFDTFSSIVHDEEQHVVGSVSIVFSWDTLLDRILPDYMKGVICVLQSSTEQEFSYSISGGTVILLGEGDMHDPKYDEYGRQVKSKLLLEGKEQIIIIT